MKKKLVVMMLTMVMAVTSLAGCGGGSDSAKSDKDSKKDGDVVEIQFLSWTAGGRAGTGDSGDHR